MSSIALTIELTSARHKDDGLRLVFVSLQELVHIDFFFRNSHDVFYSVKMLPIEHRVAQIDIFETTKNTRRMPDEKGSVATLPSITPHNSIWGLELMILEF